jgi:5'-3' exonuclease
MGIPAYFRKITTQYKNIIQPTLSNVGGLYLDLNCGIHKCCREILDKNDAYLLTKDELEEQMIDNIIKYILKLYKYSNPSQILYIAIDGVAPRAKMVQQRVRRFKSKKEYNEINKIKKKYGEDKKALWDTNAITPGTIFMDKLSKSIHNYFKYFQDNVQVIISDSRVPGEGEHKIFNYIKDPKNNINDDLNHVVYGLDADLIMLALSVNKDNMFLIREELEFKPEENGVKEFLYLNINKLGDGIVLEMISDGLNYENMDKWDLINDYIVICFLLGNDFIPHLLSLEIRHDGLNIVIDEYIKVYNNRLENLIIQQKSLNLEFLEDLLKSLAGKEESRLQFLTKKILSYNWYPESQLSDMDKEINQLQNYPLFHREKENLIQLGISTNWRNEYYNNILMIDDDYIEELCRNYLEGFIWTMSYYFKSCPSTNWYYRFEGGPSIRTLIDNISLVKKISFGKEKEIFPFDQLLMVLPTESNHLLPESYKSLQKEINSPLIEYYPTDYLLNSYYKRYYWESTPILPKINLSNIKNATKKLHLSDDELERNQNMKPINMGLDDKAINLQSI